MSETFALNMGLLPIVNRVLIEYDLKPIIEDWIGKLGPNVKISSSNLVAALTGNMLNCAAESMYATSEFYKMRPTRTLFGCDSSDINRHVIGRLLDKIHEVGGAKLFMALASTVCKNDGHKVTVVHGDSTSFHYHGDSFDEEMAVVITQGYSRDAHPELKQVCSFMMVDSETSLPIAFLPFDGNKSDKTLFPEFIDAYGLTLGSYFSDLKYVVEDSAGITSNNLNKLKDANLYLISCLPNNFKATKETYEVSKESMSPIYPDQEDSPLAYLIKDCIDINGVKMKALTVYNPNMEKKKEKTVLNRANKQFQEVLKSINILSRQTFDSERDAEGELSKIVKNKKYIYIKSQKINEVISHKRGRPRNDGSSDIKRYSINAEIGINDEFVNKEIDIQVRHTIVTTDCDRNWTEKDLFETYHHQERVERGWRTMKSPRFFADSIFLKTPSRIESFLWLMTFSLMILTIIENKVQKVMDEKKLTIPSPSNENKMKKPTSKRIVQYIHHMNIQLVCESTGKLQIFNLQSDLWRILSALGDKWLGDYQARTYEPERHPVSL